MDYEKNYKEALEIAKDIINRLEKGENILLKADLKLMFPQLKESESEDERIRKAIIDFFGEPGRKEYILNGFNVDDILAWLEKQGEQPKKVPIWKHWKNGIAGNGEGESIYLIKYGYTYSLSSCLHFECDYIELSELDKLLSEKQDEQKVSYTTLVETGNGGINALVTKELPTNGCNEQKPFDYENANIRQKDFAPKIEPKFKVGDWITNGEYTWKIVEVKSLDYILQSQDGNIVDDTISYVDEYFHLWTIQDIKDCKSYGTVH